MTPDEPPADMEAVVSEWLDMAQRVEPSTISTIRGVPVCQTEIDYIRDLLLAYQEQRRALEAAPPVVPVGVRERVLDELDKAWLHGQRRTSWRRDESADAIIAALRPTDTGWRDIATAPRDGGDILLNCETGGCAIGRPNGDGTFDDGDFRDHMDGFTHWMPLPAAPTDTGRE